MFLNSCFVGLGDAVLFGICEDDVHVFVEGEEGANHHPAILDGDPYSEVDPLQEFAALGCHQFIIDKLKTSIIKSDISFFFPRIHLIILLMK